jgi:hypothetical protein
MKSSHFINRFKKREKKKNSQQQVFDKGKKYLCHQKHVKVSILESKQEESGRKSSKKIISFSIFYLHRKGQGMVLRFVVVRVGVIKRCQKLWSSKSYTEKKTEIIMWTSIPHTY